MNELSLGDRMKMFYEDRTRIKLPRRTNTIIRIDGKAFHSFTKGFGRPFDNDLIHCMQYTAFQLCKEIQGVKFAYIQSDEISLLLSDYDQLTTDAWFDGNIQKMVSIASSTATAHFNEEIRRLKQNVKLAMFDARAFTIPEVEEVVNYFVWRQQDFTRNSVQMAARSLYSHKECSNKNNSELQEMIFQKGINWNDYPVHQKRGTCIKRMMKTIITDDGDTVRRKTWGVDKQPPIFTQDRNYILEVFEKS